MKKLITTALVTLISCGAYATPQLLWDNEEGLLSADSSCEIVGKQESPFRVSRYYGRGNSNTENLRNFRGVKQSNLINFSLLKKIEGREKRNYFYLEVVGINDGLGINKHRYHSERGDKGYLFHESTLPAEDFVFEVKIDALTGKTEQSVISTISNLDASKDLYIRIAADSQYYEYKCGDSSRTYPAFRVYQRGHGHKPLFYLGVSSNETSLFKSFKSIKKTSAMSYLSEVGNERPIPEFGHEGVVINNQGAVISSLRPVLRPRVEPQMDGTANSEPEINVDIPDPENKAVLNSLERVTCMGSRTLNIRSKSLDEVLFKATLGETVKVFQSWGEDDLKKTIGGIEYNFVKVEFSNRESDDEKVGYVADSFIKEKEKCSYLGKISRENMATATITGLNDGKCCDFPTVEKPTHSYTSGMRRFGAGRSGGRAHAACDLYRFINEPVRSVAPGKVISDLYYFYQGTFAIEVKHSGGFIARYGEITGKRPSDTVRGGKIRKNSMLTMGQRLGFIGKVNSNCCRPMLHFELYRGNKSGSLSTSSGRYKRRSDLLNPTEYLLRWEDDVF